MKALFHLAICGALLASGAMAQRGGGGHGGGGGGFHGGGGMGGGGFRGGGGMMGGGGFRGGGATMGGGGFRGGAVGGFGGFRGGGAVGGFGGFRGGYGYGYRGYGFRGYGGYYGGYYPWYGYGFGYGWPYYDGYGDYGYPYASYGDYSYPDSGYGYPASYPAYASQPSTVNVVYPPAQPPVYVDRANPVVREYDQYGQQVSGPDSYNTGAASNSGSSPIYLIATRDHTIQAALAYSVNGSVLQYTTLDHQQKRVPLDQVDRDLTQRLNRERHVSFQMPH